jgi:hypothetical protein
MYIVNIRDLCSYMKNYSGACLAMTSLQLICSQGPLFIDSMKNYSRACLAVTLLQLICSHGPMFIHEELLRGLPSSDFTSADLFFSSSSCLCNKYARISQPVDMAWILTNENINNIIKFWFCFKCSSERRNKCLEKSHFQMK